MHRRRKSHEPGIRDEHFIPWIENAHKGQIQCFLSTGRYNDFLVCLIVNALVLLHVFGERLSKSGHSSVWRIVNDPLIQSALRSLFDIQRRVEVGPAYLEVDYLDTAGLQ